METEYFKSLNMVDTYHGFKVLGTIMIIKMELVIKQFVCFLLGSMYLFSCTMGNGDKKEVMIKEDSLSVEKDIIMENNEEGFNEFFTKFISDSLTQIQNIEFPLLVKTYDPYENNGEGNLEERFLKTSDWRFEKLDTIGFSKLEGRDKYKVDIEQEKNQVVYKIIGIDNGINCSYLFKRDGKSWVLSEITR